MAKLKDFIEKVKESVGMKKPVSNTIQKDMKSPIEELREAIDMLGLYIEYISERTYKEE